MNIPARLIRAVVQDIPGLRPEITPQAQRTRELILTAAVDTFAHLGRKGISMRALAEASWISRDRIRVHFLDIDSLLAEILEIHLRGIGRALGNAPNTPKDRRAAYFAYTRGPFGNVTKEHALLIFERKYLPPDLLPAIQHAHLLLGQLLCPENPTRALEILDDPGFDLEEVEILHTPKSAKAPQPQRDLATLTDEELEAHCPEGESPEDESLRAECPEAGPVSAPPPPLPTPPSATIRRVLSPARPAFSRPPRPDKTMASLLRPPDDPPGPVPIFHRARAAPSTA
jgi:AcrR family transcriptional regulator